MASLRDVGGETVRVFGHPKELEAPWRRAVTTFRRARSQAGLELNLPCLVVTGQGSSGCKIIEEFLPDAA